MLLVSLHVIGFTNLPSFLKSEYNFFLFNQGCVAFEPMITQTRIRATFFTMEENIFDFLPPEKLLFP